MSQHQSRQSEARAHTNPHSPPLCSYCVDRVYRGNTINDTPAGGQPLELLEADFDLVWTLPQSDVSRLASGGSVPGSSSSANELGTSGDGRGVSVAGISGIDRSGRRAQASVLEAEVLMVAAEVASCFLAQLGPFYFRINHARVR